MLSFRRHSPNPKRQAAGRRNRLLRGPLTAEGRERLRRSALKNQPWAFATGPKTEAGKASDALGAGANRFIIGPKNDSRS